MRGICVVAYGGLLLASSCTPDESSGVQHEVCDNGIDDDDNGLTDCADLRCNYLASCLGSSSCGNGAREGRELCDGDDVAGQTCALQGFLAGVLRCNSDCGGFDSSGCIIAESCGDDELQAPEQCDGAELGGATCFARGYLEGALACTATCLFDESDCTGTNPCGNGVIDAPEQCDGAELDDQTCLTRGFLSGDLACAADCTFDESACVASVCGDGRIDADESCDGANLPDTASCVTEDFVSGTLRCNGTCDGFDTGDCTLCGNDTLDDGEICDGTDLDNTDCEDLGLLPGVLGCQTDCSGFKTTGCASCGNGTLEDHESCDPTVVASFNCSDLGYATGTAPCTSECLIDYSACSGFAQCGNGAIDGQETCDPSASTSTFIDPYTLNLVPLVCIWGSGQTLSCDNCVLDISACGFGGSDLCLIGGFHGDGYCSTCDHIGGTVDPDCPGSTCGDGRADGNTFSGFPLGPWEWCDGDDLRGATCELYSFAGGTLKCRNDCQFDFSSCVPTECGDDQLEGLEVCEASTTCADVGMTGTMNCIDCLRYTGCN